MKQDWQKAVIKEIYIALHVTNGAGMTVHHNRPSHGFVLNDADSVKDYYFDDGQVMRTRENSFFYLPKGSSYRVVDIRIGSCYAINFEADISDKPFCVSLRNSDHLLNSFRVACDAWKNQEYIRDVAAMRAVYDAIFQVQKELHRQYVSGEQISIIMPAIEALDSNFTQNDLSVSSLAALCGVSEVYFRRLFLNRFGVSPKEYMIQKRIDYAKSLLKSGDFSVSEVGVLCGYSDPCHFSREFSKRVGISPKQYMDL